MQGEDAFFSQVQPAVGRTGTMLTGLQQATTTFFDGHLVTIPGHTDDQIVVVGQINRLGDPLSLDGKSKMELYFDLAPGVM